MFRSIIQKMKDAGSFLSNPILQYIPISVKTLAESDYWSNPFNQPSPQLYLFQDAASLYATIDKLEIARPTNLPAGELYVLCSNFRTDLVLFRYLTCKFIGGTNAGGYHLFAITKKYFPRRSIHFAMYEHSGRKLRSVNYEIN